MTEIYIVGVGMTRFGKHLSRSLKDLAGEAVAGAIADAGCEIADISAAYFANAGQGALEGQHMIRGQLALRGLGFERIPIVNIENACASASTAFHQACLHLKAGEAGVALAVGAEKMYSADKQKSFSIFHGAWDVHDVQGTMRGIAELGGNNGLSGTKGQETHSAFMDIYAALAVQHMREFGTTQRQLAAVAAKNHSHSSFNPLSQYQTAMTADEVLAARPVAWPLTLPMCAPISDGAAAAILCRKEMLDRFDRSRAIRVCATELASGSNRGINDYRQHICHLAAQRAYDRAGVGPSEMSVAEVHDATAVGEIIQSENLGLCAFGEGGPLAERGVTSLGGAIPINPSGGLESKGHPIGASGLGQIFELVTQLRHEAGPRQVSKARFGIAENGGGFHGYEEAAACITILAGS